MDHGYNSSITGFNPSSLVICDGFISKKNRAYRVEKSSTFIAESAFSSPIEKTPYLRPDMSGMRCHALMTPIRDGFTIDHCPHPLEF